MTSAPSNPYKASNKFEYEFGGPIGALATMLILPPITLLLIYSAAKGELQISPSSLNEIFLMDLPNLCQNPTRMIPCLIGVPTWFVFQVFLQAILPYELVQGVKIQGSQKRLSYRINGHLAFWVTLLIIGVGWPYTQYYPDSSEWMIQFGRAPLHLLYEYYTELVVSVIVWCTILSTYLYLRSFGKDLILAHGGQSGNHIYDFFIGRELNPRFTDNSLFDWKEFCELRPGLIGWVLLNLSFLSVQYEKMGYVSGSMILVNTFHFFYVWDALYQEKAILSTMDITTDGFGFMLVFGDLAWVPFTYSLQARYLVDFDPNMGWMGLTAILMTNFLGYFIFRSSNSQKDAFRRNPNDTSVSHLEYIETKRGTRLLTSGWWGMARKINYTGDWIMGLSWCLVCGFGSIVPYFYAVYFFILLLHRSERDDSMCSEKYGDDWVTYKKMVPYRFIPGIL